MKMFKKGKETKKNMESKTKMIKLGMVVLVISLFVVSFVSAQVSYFDSVSDEGVEYDSNLLDALGNQALAEEWISKSDFEIFEIDENGTIWTHEVLVRLKDNSGVIIKGTKEEKIELMRQRDNWFKPKIEEVLLTLSEDEFKSPGKMSSGFGGQISKQGFEKLINDERIREINWPRIRPHFLLDERNIIDSYKYFILGIMAVIIVILITYIIIIKHKRG